MKIMQRSIFEWTLRESLFERLLCVFEEWTKKITNNCTLLVHINAHTNIYCLKLCNSHYTHIHFFFGCLFICIILWTSGNGETLEFCAWFFLWFACKFIVSESQILGILHVWGDQGVCRRRLFSTHITALWVYPRHDALINIIYPLISSKSHSNRISSQTWVFYFFDMNMPRHTYILEVVVATRKCAIPYTVHRLCVWPKPIWVQTTPQRTTYVRTFK